MNQSFYEELQHDFVMIRFLYDSQYDKNKMDKCVNHLQFARKMIDNKSDVYEKKLLLYCIDTMMTIINEGTAEKIYDFADTVHNIPEIFLGKRNFFSFRREMKSFRKKYGESYFPDINKIYPRFTKKAPHNSIEFFFAESDVDFKKLHPKGYWVLVALGITALIFPMILYLIYTIGINPAPNSWEMCIGFLGCFVFGTGLFNIVAAWIHQYLGHKVTVICFIGGTALISLSLFLLYH